MGNPEEILKKTLVEIATKEGLDNYQFSIKELSTEGANYSSAIFSARLVCPDKPDLKLFAKVASVAENLRTQMKADEFYAKEGYAYNDLMKIYNEIQEKHKVPLENRFVFPKFYGCNAVHLEETIVLENLAEERYTMYDRFKSVTWEFASKAIEELAKFHALSFAFQNEHPDLFPSTESSFNMTNSMPFDDFTIFRQTIDVLYSCVDGNLKERLGKFVDNNFNKEMIAKYYGPGKWNVLAHGDYRPSNIMFKRQGGRIKSLIPVDYQTLRLSSPSTDILYFVYCGTDKEFRKVHLKQLLEHYYKTLSKFLTLFKMDPEVVFSRRDFEEEFKDMQPYGLLTTLFLLPMVLVDPANAPKMNAADADIQNITITPTEAFKSRFLPTLEEFVKLGVL